MYLYPTKHLKNPHLRLCVFHHAGGSANTYLRMNSFLPQDWELVLVELPGRGRNLKSSLPESIQEMSKAIANEIKQQTSPVILWGHSFGSLLAFETAHSISPSHLLKGVGLSSYHAPNRQTDDPINVDLLSDEELLNHLRGFGFLPSEVEKEPDVQKHFLSVIRMDFRWISRYVPSRFDPLGYPLLVTWGEQDTKLKLRGLLEWKNFTSKKCIFQSYEGGHFYVFSHFQNLTTKLLELAING